MSIDLGAFLGMRHISIPLTEGGKPVEGIFIPTAINGIRVKADQRPAGKGNQSKLRAFVNFMQRTYSNAFLQTVKDNLIRKGEQVTLYNVPAYQVCYSLPEETRNIIRAALKKRILRDNPNLAGQEDVKGTELSAAISRLMPFQMGDSYLMEEQQYNSGYASPTPPQAVQQVQTFTQAAIPTPEDDPLNGGEIDDLPF